MPSHSHEIQLLPNGHLVAVDSVTGSSGSILPAPVRRAFSESPAAGLIALATDAVEDVLDPAASYWREFGAEFLVRLCQAPPSQREGEWIEVAPPSQDEMELLRSKAPPAPGMEYLSADRLAKFWAGMNAYAAAEVAEHEGALDEWLRRRNPLWRLVGRVTFHLAENKTNEEQPFAFLATYTQRLSKGGRLQYLPLGRALKQSVDKNDLRLLESLLAPVQKAAEHSELARELLDSRKVFRVLAWSPSQAFEFLQAVPHLESGGVIVKVPDWWSGGRPSRAKVAVALDAKKKTSVGFDAMLGFDVYASLEGEELTPEEWQTLMVSEGSLVSIKGRWVEVDRERLQQAMDHWRRAAAAVAEGGLSFAQGMRMMSGFFVGESGLASLDEAIEVEGGGDWSEITAGGRLRDLLSQLRDPGGDDAGGDVKLGRALRADLRPYQQQGLNWLWQLYGLGLGGCLADDMGLGKTLQVIALLLKIRSTRRERTAENLLPSLVIVPASLVGNWRAEIERFAPSLVARYAHPSQTPREELLNLFDDLVEVDVVITTYAMLSRIGQLSEISWHLVIIDEAQAIKNPRTAQTRRVKEVAKSAHARIAMTGTPIENSVADLWSLFDFLNPGLLGKATRFREITKQLVERAGEGGDGFAKLRRLVGPYILRRLKTDRTVISDLPDKTEVRASCSLTKGQATLYRRSVKQLAEDLKDKEGIERKGLVLSYLMRFKQICDHPALWTGSGNFDARESGKLKRLREICQEIASRGEKVLVFSQFREMCDPLVEFLEGDDLFGRSGLLLHGGTPVKKRQQLVEQFQSDAGPPFFVISLKAGGTGLNLTAASHVIHFDRWWNPAVEDQATDRAFRIGQKNNVLVHKFVCSGTIEDRIDKVISEKRELAGEILGSAGGAEKLLTEMGDAELIDFVSVDLETAVF
jgi:non-specific serine/threonine protein kinase